MKLHWQIFIAIGLAITAGVLSGETGGIGAFKFYDAYVFLGTLFLNALKMLIVPLIFSSIILCSKFHFFIFKSSPFSELHVTV